MTLKKRYTETHEGKKYSEKDIGKYDLNVLPPLPLTCKKGCPDIDYDCTLPRDHKGHHVAHRSNGEIVYVWLDPDWPWYEETITDTEREYLIKLLEL